MPARRIWIERQFDPGIPPEALPDLIERLRGTPARLEERIKGIPAAQLAAAPEGWSIMRKCGPRSWYPPRTYRSPQRISPAHKVETFLKQLSDPGYVRCRSFRQEHIVLLDLPSVKIAEGAAEAVRHHFLAGEKWQFYRQSDGGKRSTYLAIGIQGGSSKKVPALQVLSISIPQLGNQGLKSRKIWFCHGLQSCSVQLLRVPAPPSTPYFQNILAYLSLVKPPQRTSALEDVVRKALDSRALV